jgi:hypothetical protein
MNVDTDKNNSFKWRSFLSLEHDFLTTRDFVEFDHRHDEVFSIKYRSLILQACSEIDYLLKNILSKHKKSKDIAKMPNYIKAIEEHHVDFFNIEIELPLTQEILKPWSERKELESGIRIPIFWNDYNLIKHDGAIERSTFKNCKLSLAALFSLFLVYFKTTRGMEESKFFSYPYFFPSTLVTQEQPHKIPGFMGEC